MSILSFCMSWAALAADGRVSLQSGTAAEFARIEGVSPEIAEAIVALRTSRGQLATVEELRVLPGVDGAVLDALRGHTDVTVSFPMGASSRYDSPEQVLAEFAKEPTVQDVQRWTNDYAQTSPELVEQWLRQSRLFGALPELKVGYANAYAYDLDWDYLSDQTQTLDQAAEDVDQDWKVEVKWELDKLVMSSERIRVISEVGDVVKLRDKVLSEATTVYFERRRLQVEMLLNPKADLRGQVIDQLRLMELTANLDAMTGGMFSATLKR